MEKITLEETRLSRRAKQTNSAAYDLSSITGQRSNWIGTFRIFIKFHLVEDRSHHTVMETGDTRYK